jgi:acyl-CoA dehydrogenase
MTTTNNQGNGDDQRHREAQQLLLATANRLFGDLCNKRVLEAAEDGEFPVAAKDSLAEHGFHRLADPDSGFALCDVFAVLRVAGYHALPLPLAEWMLANRFLPDTGDDFASIGKLQGTQLLSVPWGREAHRCLGVTTAGRVASVTAADWTSDYNIAGEALDGASIVEHVPISSSENIVELLALSRCAMSVGAMTRLLELVVEQVTVREQFGRPLARFQVIQHDIARAAGEVAASGKALECALAQLESERQHDEVALACARVFEASQIISDTAHQLFGAMGFTHEHILHHYTRRLWAWREDYGNERHWQASLGRSLCAGGPDQLWPFLATRQ